MTLCLALSYGGRESIVAAARALCEAVAAGDLDADQVTEEKLTGALQTGGPAPAGPPDPHLGRGAAVELPALGSRLRRALLHRHVLARLRQGGAVPGAGVLPAAASAASDVRASRFAARADARAGRSRGRVAMSNLVQRVLSGVVALPLLGLLILWRQPLGFGVLVLVIAGLALHEYLAITLPGTSLRLRALLIAIGRRAQRRAVPGCRAWACLGRRGVHRGHHHRPARPRRDQRRRGAAGLRGVRRLLPGRADRAARDPAARRRLRARPGCCWRIALTFGNDTGAYFAGRALGRHKLYPAVSPKKTVEGAVGGLVAGLVVMFVARATVVPVADACATACWSRMPAAVVGPVGRPGRVADQARLGRQGLRAASSRATAASSTASTRCCSSPPGSTSTPSTSAERRADNKRPPPRGLRGGGLKTKPKEEERRKRG